MLALMGDKAGMSVPFQKSGYGYTIAPLSKIHLDDRPS